MEPLILPSLFFAGLLALTALLIAVVLWFMHHAVSRRLDALEVRQESALSHVEVRVLYAELAEIKGRLATTTDLMRNVQEYLLERDQ
jgi:hypothetical protein